MMTSVMERRFENQVRRRGSGRLGVKVGRRDSFNSTNLVKSSATASLKMKIPKKAIFKPKTNPNKKLTSFELELVTYYPPQPGKYDIPDLPQAPPKKRAPSDEFRRNDKMSLPPVKRPVLGYLPTADQAGDDESDDEYLERVIKKKLAQTSNLSIRPRKGPERRPPGE